MKKKQSYLKRLLFAVAISGFGIGCSGTPAPSDTQASDLPVAQEAASESVVEPQIEVIDDNTLRYPLSDGAFGFELSKGWPVESIENNSVSFKRENQFGFSSLKITVEEGRTPEQFIQDLYPNVDSEGATYIGAMHGSDGRYLTAGTSEASGGAFAQFLNGKLVTVTYATKGDPEAEIGFLNVIASLKTTETE